MSAYWRESVFYQTHRMGVAVKVAIIWKRLVLVVSLYGQGTWSFTLRE
jgi:hypothetical protein